jgi:DNA-binding transcriptional ArsR family regulator
VTTPAEPIDLIFAALGHPIRRKIVAHLANSGDASVGDLAAPFEVTLMAVSKHIRVLTEAGVVTMQKEGRVHWCRVNQDALRQAVEWLEYQRAASSEVLSDKA